MFRPLRAAGALVPALTALVAPASAESLVQLGLHGRMGTEGGALVQIEVDVWTGAEVQRHDLHVHLAQSTTARELATLLAARLEAAGATVVATDPHDESAAPQLFVSDATAVNLRLGHGLWGEVTICEEAPESIRLVEPQLARGAATLELTATTWHPHLERMGRLRLEHPIAEDTNPGAISQGLAEAARASGWIGERPTPDRWSPLRADGGAQFVGCNVRLAAPTTDWRLEVQLRVPE